MRGASLFTGAGGLDLGLHLAGHEIVLQCESDPHARQVLRRRFPGVRLEPDVAALAALPEETEVLAAGFPCVDVSRAGLRAGLAGSGSGLVRHVFRLLRGAARAGRPVPWVLLENVPGLLERGGGGLEAPVERVVSGLEALGYAWAQRVVCTAAFGLPNRRRRVFILASLHGDPRDPLLSGGRSPECPGDCADVLGAPCARCREASLRRRDPSLKETMVAIDLGNAQAAGGFDMIPCLKTGNGSQILLLQGPHRVGLLPVGEAERLQGFPQGYTLPCYPLVPPGIHAHRDPPPLLKDAAARDALRWHLLGNAVSVPVARWLGEQLARPYAGKYVPTEGDRPMGWVPEDEALGWVEAAAEPGAERAGLWRRPPPPPSSSGGGGGVRGGRGRGLGVRVDRVNERALGPRGGGVTDEGESWPRSCWFLPGHGRFRCEASEYPVVRRFVPLGQFLRHAPLRLPPGYEMQRLQTYLRRLQAEGWDVSETVRVLFACGRDLHDISIKRDVGRTADVGEIVWARVPGFPWWPAEVVEPHEIPEHLFEGIRSLGRGEKEAQGLGALRGAGTGGADCVDEEAQMLEAAAGGAATAAARSELVPRTPGRVAGRAPSGARRALGRGEGAAQEEEGQEEKEEQQAKGGGGEEEGGDGQCWDGQEEGEQERLQDDVEASAQLVPYVEKMPRAPREGFAHRPEQTRFVVFFGTKRDSAWVPEGDILDFEEHKAEVLSTARVYGHDKKPFKEGVTLAELALKVRRRQATNQGLTAEEEAEFLGASGARHRAAVQQAARVASSRKSEPCGFCHACRESQIKGQTRKCLVQKVVAAYLAGRVGAEVSRLGEKAKGARLSVYWPLDFCFYDCTVVGFDAIRMKHLLYYDDGESESIALWSATQEIQLLNTPADFPEVFTEWEAAREAERRAEEEKKAGAKAERREKAEKEKAWRQAQLEPAPVEQLTPAERARREKMQANERQRQCFFNDSPSEAPEAAGTPPKATARAATRVEAAQALDEVPEKNPELESGKERAQKPSPEPRPSPADGKTKPPTEQKRGRASPEPPQALEPPAQGLREPEAPARHEAEGPVKKFKGMSGVADFTAMFSTRGLSAGLGPVLPSSAVTHASKVVKEEPGKRGAEVRRSWFG